jgi:hypothetical protein
MSDRGLWWWLATPASAAFDTKEFWQQLENSRT